MAKRTKTELAATTVAAGLNIGVGYVWGRYDLAHALIVYGAIMVALFAALGLVAYGEGKFAA